MPTTNATDLVTTREVADALGLSTSRIRQLQIAGRITPALTGPRWTFYDRSTIDTLRAELAADRRTKLGRDTDTED